MNRHADWMSILIEKVEETPASAEYAFISDVYEADPARKGRSIVVGNTRGVLRITKATGGIVLIDPMPEDSNEKRFRNAAARIYKHWQAGEYPDKTRFSCG